MLNRSRRGLALLAAAILAVLSFGTARAEPVKAAVVSLALWGDGSVFRSEAQGAAQVVSQRYGHGDPVIVRINTRKSLAAGPRGMVQALQEAQRRADPQKDILILIFTSHGAPQGIAVKGGRTEGLLPPQALGRLLEGSAFRKKVLIVSACYAGIFTPLANDDTLVITAADANHPSFGCEEGNTWTYFGDAFFNHALRHGGAMRDLFAEAQGLIRAREQSQGFEPSNPQIAGGANVLPLLDASGP